MIYFYFSRFIYLLFYCIWQQETIEGGNTDLPSKFIGNSFFGGVGVEFFLLQDCQCCPWEILGRYSIQASWSQHRDFNQLTELRKSGMELGCWKSGHQEHSLSVQILWVLVSFFSPLNMPPTCPIASIKF